MKLFLLSIFASVAGATAGLLLFLIVSYGFYGGGVSQADVFGCLVEMSVPAFLLCGLLYTPGLLWLRRRRKSCAPTLLFVLTPAFVLNIPAFLVLLAGLSAGSVFFGWYEVLLFAFAFIVAGLIFGRGFVSYCESKTV